MNSYRWRGLLAGCLLLFVSLAQAAPQGATAYAVVDSVQMPAWVERKGVREPLVPGQVLRNHDRVITGADARVAINLAEGSAVKLGENAQLEMNALGYRENRVFTAALDVAQGAFRFTTGVFRNCGKSVRSMYALRALPLEFAALTCGVARMASATSFACWRGRLRFSTRWMKRAK